MARRMAGSAAAPLAVRDHRAGVGSGVCAAGSAASGIARQDVSDGSHAEGLRGGHVLLLFDDDVWAASDFGTLARWTGAAWTDTLPVGDDNFLDGQTSVWGAAADDIWAVGDLGAISHWDGAGWTQIQTGKFPYYPFLTKVHGSSPDDVWVAGRAANGTNAPVILHNGK